MTKSPPGPPLSLHVTPMLKAPLDDDTGVLGEQNFVAGNP